MAAFEIHRVTRLDLAFTPWRWPFADARREEIDAHFETCRIKTPQLWNGKILLARNPVFTGDCFRAQYFETDFASFLAWRDWGFPDATVFNGFGAGALHTPVPGWQTPMVWQPSGAGHVTPMHRSEPAHAPAVHLSAPVFGSPSSHAVPLATLDQPDVELAGVHTWQALAGFAAPAG